MMSENYAVINGNRIELTNEQVKALGIKKNNPFERVAKSEKYCYIDGLDEIHWFSDDRGQCDNDSFECSNYFNDEGFAKQVALHQLLYRKLLKFAWDNEAEDIEWDHNNIHYYIYYDCYLNSFCIGTSYNCKNANIFFSEKDAAQRAIKEVVEPFVKEHPEFVW